MPKATKTNSTKTDIDRLATLSKKDCPVMGIMKRTVAVRKAWQDLEGTEGADKDKIAELWDTTHILLNMASVTRAESLQGALFQLGILMETVHVDLFQNIDGKIQDELLPTEQKAMRLLQSAASVIEKVIGEEAAAEAKDIWLSDDNLSKIERVVNGPIGRRAA